MSADMPPLNVERSHLGIVPDPTRVLLRYFEPGPDERSRGTLERILSLPEDEVSRVLAEMRSGFAHRHREFEATLYRHFTEQVARHVPEAAELSDERRLVLAAYFTMEYSVEAAALFNPSIIPHPDQEGVLEGAVRFIMSLRATGEGHISSIAFRSGILDSACVVSLDPISRSLEIPELQKDSEFEEYLFELQLAEMGAYNDAARAVCARLPEAFTHQQLLAELSIAQDKNEFSDEARAQAEEAMKWLAHSNYHVKFREDGDLSERLLFPISENESNGIEDARFVRFVDDDGTVTYYATYTAYNGRDILPQLIETKDFVQFKIITLSGAMVRNKGMALFPRRIDGKYAMISRHDGVNLYIMFSDHPHFWREAQILRRPRNPWEYMHIGNCGSPVETEAGWLLLTHGVGPIRKYCIGIDLLDLQDPSNVIASLDEPLLAPNESEREGYVPNVLYTCGCMIHQGQLMIPYAMSDSKCSMARVPVREVLDRLLRQGK